MKGLENAVGKDTAAKVAKGCRVHFIRSVKRVSERVNKNNPKSHKAFMAVANLIPNSATREESLLLFDILSGELIEATCT